MAKSDQFSFADIDSDVVMCGGFHLWFLLGSSSSRAQATLRIADGNWDDAPCSITDSETQVRPMSSPRCSGRKAFLPLHHLSLVRRERRKTSSILTTKCGRLASALG